MPVIYSDQTYGSGNYSGNTYDNAGVLTIVPAMSARALVKVWSFGGKLSVVPSLTATDIVRTFQLSGKLNIVPDMLANGFLSMGQRLFDGVLGVSPIFHDAAVELEFHFDGILNIDPDFADVSDDLVYFGPFWEKQPGAGGIWNANPPVYGIWLKKISPPYPWDPMPEPPQ